MKELSYALYIHTNKNNGKKYVGVTSAEKPQERWGKNGRGYKEQPIFWNAIQEYGWDNFEHEIVLTGLSYEEIFEEEKFYIMVYNTNNPAFGYNSTGGGCGRPSGEYTYPKESMELRKSLGLENFHPYSRQNRTRRKPGLYSRQSRQKVKI